jgi:hypothetical protein
VNGRVHLFLPSLQPDGSTVLSLLRREDLRELKLTALIHVLDRAVDVKKLGEIACEALDRELVSRPQA